MSEHLETSLLHDRLRSSNTDGAAYDLRVNYECENESPKPIFLELGATSSSPRHTPELSLLNYVNNYPLDMHVNSAFDTVFPSLSHAFNINPAALYTNPYNNKIPTTTSEPQHISSSHSTVSSSMIPRNLMSYTAHLPQSVYSWSTPAPVPNATRTDVNNKLVREIVPPPVYLTYDYSDIHEHTIYKQENQARKEKPKQNEKDYRKTACDRERTRMRDMNKAFDLLRTKLPISKPNGKKYSKIESLRIAINYINHLQQVLRENTADELNQIILNESFEDANDRFENFDESRSTWSDGYLPNSDDKWE